MRFKLLFLKILLVNCFAIAQTTNYTKIDLLDLALNKLTLSYHIIEPKEVNSEIGGMLMGNLLNFDNEVTANLAGGIKYSAYLHKQNAVNNAFWFVKPELFVFYQALTLKIQENVYYAEQVKFNQEFVDNKITTQGYALSLNIGQYIQKDKWLFEYYFGLGSALLNVKQNSNHPFYQSNLSNRSIFGPVVYFPQSGWQTIVQGGIRLGYQF